MCLSDVLRKRVTSNLRLQQYVTACYWADKLVCLEKYRSEDVLLYAKALYYCRQYHRAVTLIQNCKELKQSLVCRYFIAQCYYACSEYKKALEFLEQSDCSSDFNSNVSSLVAGPLSKQLSTSTDSQSAENGSSSKQLNNVSDNLISGFTTEQLHSSIALLKGKLYELMENRSLAMQYYKEALLFDVTCYEAFEKLVNFQSISSEEESALLSELSFTDHLDPLMGKLTEFLYKDKLNKNSVSETEVPNEFDSMNNDVDVIVNKAGRMLDVCRFQECYDITSRLIQSDPYNLACLPIYISVLKELEKANELFKVSHRLMDVYPSSALAWFSVGCYYLCIKKNELARRHLVKATQLDRRYGPVWLTLGHAFATDGEHDQAIASYCTAAQVIRGSHIPIMYIGIEYSASNNRNLAERFLNQAYLISPSDPFVLHELGTLAFESQKYVDATRFLARAYERACELSGQVPSPFWEPLVNNLAHSYRKMGLYSQAIAMHELALRLVPESPTTLACLAMLHAINGNLEVAVDYLHRSVGVQPSTCGSTSSNVASTMLNVCIEALTEKGIYASNHKVGKDIPDTLPEPLMASAGPGSLPGSNHVRFKSVSAEASKPAKSALHLDVNYRRKSSDAPNTSLNTSDEDISMDLN
ncbi:Cell division cycle protein 16 like [Schistosoma japonicum]|uniref:CDC16 cell division cycle 16 homolog n=1 Tax=Schistosoma japonicum TaxID=6182 RepID=C1LIM6_SCHJA|nr:Cell division cycle protein 16 like [Schistosoma japonicum]CAX74554.1 CDC16 cell division cycle 16 homolog [Schistosoma japonicum]